MTKLLTTSEAAEQLNCSTRHIIRMIEAGRLRAKDIGVGSHHEWRIYPDSIDQIDEPVTKPKKKRRKMTGIERFV